MKVVPSARFGLATNGAAALLDDSQNGRKAQTGSLADLFRREERLEDMSPHLRVHSDPGVAHGHQSRSGPAQAPESAASASVEGHVGRFNGQRTASGHGVPGVQRKVHDRAADFAGVGPHLPEAGLRNRRRP